MEEIIIFDEVKVGEHVTDFTTEAFLPNGEFGKVSLSDNMKDGKWTIVFFWPLDFTFVCPTEIKSMSEMYEKFTASGAEVFGVSTDSVHTHKAWCEHTLGKIKFPMLQDTNHEISSQFGVLNEEEGIATRGAFIIDPEGILQSAMINNLNVGRNTDEILRLLEAFQCGGLCPVNWSKGDDTL